MSSRGYNYIFVAYHYDANYIALRPIKNRSAGELCRVYQEVFTFFAERGLAPLHHKMDNECPKALENIIIHTNKNTLQLVPPNDHRTNPAERAIQTAKAHLIAGLSSVDPLSPLYLWCCLLPQAEQTLALLRSSNIRPHLSSYTHVHGELDYNATPFAPPGLKTLIYETPAQRRSWAQHGVVGWYIGPSHNHYRCYKCYVPATRGTWDPNTVQFYPHDFAVPKISMDNDMERAMDGLVQDLKHAYS